MSWTLYILKCADDTFYTGITNDVEKRLRLHGSGKGAKYLRGRIPFEMVHQEAFETRSEALKREAAIKSLSRAQKLSLIYPQ